MHDIVLGLLINREDFGRMIYARTMRLDHYHLSLYSIAGFKMLLNWRTLQPPGQYIGNLLRILCA
jgi:hypothetical protein